jgi:hypothetical protein
MTYKISVIGTGSRLLRHVHELKAKALVMSSLSGVDLYCKIPCQELQTNPSWKEKLGN